MKAGAVWRDSDTASTPVFPIFPLCEWLSLPVGSASRSSPASALSLGPHRLRLALRLARQGEIDRALPLSRQHKLLALCHSSDRRLRDDAAVNGGGAALSRGFCDCAGIRHRHRLFNACLCRSADDRAWQALTKT